MKECCPDCRGGRCVCYWYDDDDELDCATCGGDGFVDDELARLGVPKPAPVTCTIDDVKKLGRIAGHLATIATHLESRNDNHARTLRLAMKQDEAELSMLAQRIERALSDSARNGGTR